MYRLLQDHGGQTGRGGTYRESADGVDSQLVQIRVGHDGGGAAGMMLDGYRLTAGKASEG